MLAWGLFVAGCGVALAYLVFYVNIITRRPPPTP